MHLYKFAYCNIYQVSYIVDTFPSGTGPAPTFESSSLPRIFWELNPKIFSFKLTENLCLREIQNPIDGPGPCLSVFTILHTLDIMDGP